MAKLPQYASGNDWVCYEARARGFSSSLFDVMLGWVRNSTLLLRVVKKGYVNFT
jgi:hypothetical protein